MTEIDLNLVCELVAQDKGDVTIAERFAVTRHAARKLIEQAKVELARRERRGDADVVVLDPEPETIPEFVEAITKCLRKSVEGIIEAGRHLNNARIKHAGEFSLIVERDLGMTLRTANRFMAIAKDARFKTHGSYLPTTWRTLYELTRLDDEEFERGIESGAIHPGMEREDAIRLKNPAAAPPEGEGPPAAGYPGGSSPAAAVPPHQDLVAEPAHPARGRPTSMGDDPAGDSGSDQGKQEGTADDRDSRGRHGPQPSSFPPRQESESEVMPSGPEHGETNVDTPPRPAVSEPGGADESRPFDKIAEGLNEAIAIARGEAEPARVTTLPTNHRAIAPSRTEPSDSLDFFPTPPWATRALIERVLPRLGIRHTDSTRITHAWEPACGEGHMVEVLKEYVQGVLYSDIHDYGYATPGGSDFLSMEHDDSRPFDSWIITNPPFGDKSLPFLLRALELAKIGVAVFVRSQWAVEGINKYEQVYRDRPPTLFAPFMERVNLCKGRWDPDGSTATAYCWLIWVKNRAPKAPFWIPPGCRESLTKPDDAERFTAHPVKRKEFPSLDMGHHPEAAESDRNAGPGQPAASSLRSGEMPDMPEFLDRRKEQTESN